jgi:hypothetical protein
MCVVPMPVCSEIRQTPFVDFHLFSFDLVTLRSSSGSVCGAMHHRPDPAAFAAFFHRFSLMRAPTQTLF